MRFFTKRGNNTTNVGGGHPQSWVLPGAKKKKPAAPPVALLVLLAFVKSRLTAEGNHIQLEFSVVVVVSSDSTHVTTQLELVVVATSRLNPEGNHIQLGFSVVDPICVVVASETVHGALQPATADAFVVVVVVDAMCIVVVASSSSHDALQLVLTEIFVEFVVVDTI